MSKDEKIRGSNEARSAKYINEEQLENYNADCGTWDLAWNAAIDWVLKQGTEVRSYGERNVWRDPSKAGDGVVAYSVGDEDVSAVLINIQPIKKETAESVLRDFVESFHPDDYETDTAAFDLIHRAKKVLKEKL